MLLDKIEKGSDGIVFIYTMCGGSEEARDIGYAAVEEKLAISADYWITNSIYPWQGVLHETDQWMLVLSTQKLISEKLMEFIESKHSYNIPTIIRSDVLLTNKSFSLWLDNTINSDIKYITEEDDKIKRQHESKDYQFGRLK
jgi:periplasmic divalent cation tolerance protein